MPSLPALTIFTALVAALGAAQSAHAIAIDTVETFQGSPPPGQPTFGWNGGAQPTIKVDGGPSGVGDSYLQITSSGGASSGGHLAVPCSEGQWVGDYQAAGVTGIACDFQNLSSQTLQMRLVLFGLGTRFTSVFPFTLEPNQGWTSVVFPIGESDLTRVFATSSYQDVITQVNQIMFRHDSSPPSSGGTSIAATLGIDNVRAIPAPGAGAALALGGMLAFRRRRR